ncbi:MazG family protein [Rhodococcus phenolicus]|uniref:MazG family protein n=1 Tax=Rhodococcus phenolicus TaxID=263849 RepID=UPI0008376E77|nr:MazG family protein [Rhodococcus phenolicus]
MSVVLLDPRRPAVVPAAAVRLLRGPVEYAGEVPDAVRAALGLDHDPGAEVLVALDAGSDAVTARIARGETVVAADPVVGDRLLDAVDIMDRLWGFGGWEVTQTHDSLRRYLLEETYELLDAIDEDDRAGLREELGDLLLQVLFHSRIAQESATDPFDVDDVADTLVAKLESRSPHLTNGHTGPLDVAEQEAAWQAAKAAEKPRSSCLDGIVMAQPALVLAEKVLERAQAAGVPTDLIPEDVTLVHPDRTGRAEQRLRGAVLAFADRIRAVESAAAQDRGFRGSLCTKDWREYWL